MAATFTHVLALTRVAAATLVGERFVTLLGAIPAAAAGGVGVARTGATTGSLVTLDVIGTAVVEAGAAIADGALVETDNLGRAITRASGVQLGRALQPASGAGVKIEVLLFGN
jgi:hypothetical protein